MNRARMNARRGEARTSSLPADVAIWRKVDAARKAVAPVAKKGEHFGEGKSVEYLFARIEDVARQAKKALCENGLLIVPAAVDDHRSWSEKYGLILKVEMEFMVVDVETGHSITLPWIGYGQDRPGDKAINKGTTGARKYFLISLLEIEVGEDPEFNGTSSAAERSKSPEAQRVVHRQDRAAEQADPPAPDEVDEAKELAHAAG